MCHVAYLSQSKTIQSYDSNGLDWIFFISQLLQKKNKMHSNVTMCANLFIFIMAPRKRCKIIIYFY
jgi:hypothetical protein